MNHRTTLCESLLYWEFEGGSMPLSSTRCQRESLHKFILRSKRSSGICWRNIRPWSRLREIIETGQRISDGFGWGVEIVGLKLAYYKEW